MLPDSGAAIGSVGGPVTMEHRHGARRQVVLGVLVRSLGGESVHAVVRNVSISGAFVECSSDRWRAFTTVEVVATCSDSCGEPAWQVTAMIVRVTPDGIGVLFDELNTTVEVVLPTVSWPISRRY